MGYRTVDDPSVFVRFELLDVPARPELVGASLLVWTTTPWTLPSNTGIAVLASGTYAEVEHEQGGNDPKESKPHPQRLAEPVQEQEIHRESLCVGALYGERSRPTSRPLSRPPEGPGWV